MNSDDGKRLEKFAFNTVPVTATRFGRKRRTLECGLHDVACVAGVNWEGQGRSKRGKKGEGIGERGKGTPAAKTDRREET